MKKNIVLSIFLNVIFLGSELYGIAPTFPEFPSINLNQQDTLKENQILYNGRMWRNLYAIIRGDQFLFSSNLLPGSVTISGETFKNINIRYDIFNDEIMTQSNTGLILQLNKEMVDSFTILFQNKTYKFTKVLEDSVKGFQGYVNVLVTGKSSLYVKYKKEIAILAVDNKYDLFFQTQKIFFAKDGVVYFLSGKGLLLNLMEDYKLQVRSYIKKNRLKFSKKDPESFIPLVRYYNSLKQ
jgi:hypothetical protein